MFPLCPAVHMFVRLSHADIGISSTSCMVCTILLQTALDESVNSNMN